MLNFFHGTMQDLLLELFRTFQTGFKRRICNVIGFGKHAIFDSLRDGKTQLVSLYHSMVIKLLEVFDSDVDLETCLEYDLTTSILNHQQLQLKYDTNNKITEMSKIDI